jgi:hypothetical protein
MSRIVPVLRLRTSPRQASKDGEARCEDERTEPAAAATTRATTPKSPTNRGGSKLSGLKKKLTPPKFGRSKSDRDVTRSNAADTISPLTARAKPAPLPQDKPSSESVTASTGLARWSELLMEEKTASMDDSLVLKVTSAAARREKGEAAEEVREPESDCSASDSDDGGGYLSPGRALNALVSPRLSPIGGSGGRGGSPSTQESRNCAQAKALAALRAAQPHVFER